MANERNDNQQTPPRATGKRKRPSTPQGGSPTTARPRLGLQMAAPTSPSGERPAIAAADSPVGQAPLLSTPERRAQVQEAPATPDQAPAAVPQPPAEQLGRPRHLARSRIPRASSAVLRTPPAYHALPVERGPDTLLTPPRAALAPRDPAALTTASSSGSTGTPSPYRPTSSITPPQQPEPPVARRDERANDVRRRLFFNREPAAPAPALPRLNLLQQFLELEARGENTLAGIAAEQERDIAEEERARGTGTPPPAPIEEHSSPGYRR